MYNFKKATDKLVTILKINLPQELVQLLIQYLYYTSQQILIRDMHRRVHYCIKSATHANTYWNQSNSYFKSHNYLFNYKDVMIYMRFCKCGDYKFSPDMNYCVICKCSNHMIL